MIYPLNLLWTWCRMWSHLLIMQQQVENLSIGLSHKGCNCMNGQNICNNLICTKNNCKLLEVIPLKNSQGKGIAHYQGEVCEKSQFCLLVISFIFLMIVKQIHVQTCFHMFLWHTCVILLKFFLIYSMCIWIAFPNFPICPMKSGFPEHQMMFFLVKYDVPNYSA